MIASGDLTHRGRRERARGRRAVPAGARAAAARDPRQPRHPALAAGAGSRSPAGSSSAAGGRRRPSFSAPGARRSRGSELGSAARLPARPAQARRARARPRRSCATAPPGALRVVALHHQLDRRAVAVREAAARSAGARVLARLADAGAELILGGHIHQATVVERQRLRGLDGDGAQPACSRPRRASAGRARAAATRRAACSSTAPTRARSRVETHIWRGEAWALTGYADVPALSPLRRRRCRERASSRRRSLISSRSLAAYSNRSSSAAVYISSSSVTRASRARRGPSPRPACRGACASGRAARRASGTRRCPRRPSRSTPA